MKNTLSRIVARVGGRRTRNRSALRVGLAVLAAVLIVLLPAQGLRYYLAGRRESTILESLKLGSEGPPGRTEIREAKEYDVIAKKGTLGKADDKKKPPAKLWGIMGNEALLGASAKDAKAYAVGGKLPDGEKVVRIGINEVVVEKDGREQTLYVHDVLKPSAKEKPKSPKDKAPADKDTAVPAPPEGTDEKPSVKKENDDRTENEARARRSAETIKKELKEQEAREQ